MEINFQGAKLKLICFRCFIVILISTAAANFDVLNPPLISVAAGVGTNALVQPVVSGSFTDVFVDSQDYDIEKILSINISGGNGTGAVIEPIITKRHRIVSFDAKSTSSGGGVSLSNDRIRYLITLIDCIKNDELYHMNIYGIKQRDRCKGFVFNLDRKLVIF